MGLGAARRLRPVPIFHLVMCAWILARHCHSTAWKSHPQFMPLTFHGSGLTDLQRGVQDTKVLCEREQSSELLLLSTSQRCSQPGFSHCAEALPVRGRERKASCCGKGKSEASLLLL